MQKLKIKVKKLHPEAKLPRYEHPGDAGLDMFALEDYELKPGERYTFATGVSIELPSGHVGFIKDKSGLASKQGIHTMGGVMDSSYRGEYKIIMINTAPEPYQFLKGDKLAQLVVIKIPECEVIAAEELSDSSRGGGGFGSSGR